MSAWEWIILSGIPSSHLGGTGQLMRHLENKILGANRYDGTILYSPDGEILSQDQLKLLLDVPVCILFHPQMIGVEQTLELIGLRHESGRKTQIYLLDNVFFCRRSYNHIDTEVKTCLRCVGPGSHTHADEMKCLAWPKVSPMVNAFAQRLWELNADGALTFFAQTETQADLARQHFGADADVRLVGLWCEDWNEHFSTFESQDVKTSSTTEFEIVYHGSRDMAKGLGWTLSVAAVLPNLKFLIPLDRGEANFTAPPNVTVKTMRWSEGLFDAIKGAKLTLVPSLWSAPCEGALIKSILTARATAVVRADAAFSGEIPDDVLLKLSTNPSHAASQIQGVVDGSGWSPSSTARRAWVAKFKAQNADMCERLIG